MLKVHDNGNQLRIELSGRFFGKAVAEAAEHWRHALDAPTQRPVIVDISSLTGFDQAGASLLYEMVRHGTQIAARSPESLALFNELSSKRRSGPVLVYDFGDTSRPTKVKAKSPANVLPMRMAASGK